MALAAGKMKRNKWKNDGEEWYDRVDRYRSGIVADIEVSCVHQLALIQCEF